MDVWGTGMRWLHKGHMYRGRLRRRPRRRHIHTQSHPHASQWHAMQSTSKYLTDQSDAHPRLEPATKRLGDRLSQHRPRMASRLSWDSPSGKSARIWLSLTSTTTTSPAVRAGTDQCHLFHFCRGSAAGVRTLVLCKGSKVAPLLWLSRLALPADVESVGRAVRIWAEIGNVHGR